MTTNNYEHYFTVKATITDGVVSFALDSSVHVPHKKPLWNDDTGSWHRISDAPLDVQDDDQEAYATLFDLVLSKYKNNKPLGDK